MVGTALDGMILHWMLCYYIGWHGTTLDGMVLHWMAWYSLGLKSNISIIDSYWIKCYYIGSTGSNWIYRHLIG